MRFRRQLGSRSEHSDPEEQLAANNKEDVRRRDQAQAHMKKFTNTRKDRRESRRVHTDREWTEGGVGLNRTSSTRVSHRTDHVHTNK
jgi:hypothetical protein